MTERGFRDRSNVGARQTLAALLLTCPQQPPRRKRMTVVRDRSNVGPRQTSAALLLTCPQQLPRRKRMTERGFRDRSNVGARQTLAALLLTCPQQPPRRKRMTVVRDRSNVGPRQTLAALLLTCPQQPPPQLPPAFDLSPRIGLQLVSCLSGVTLCGSRPSQSSSSSWSILNVAGQRPIRRS